MQFDNNTPMSNPYGVSYYDNESDEYLSCGTPLVSFEGDSGTKELFNYNLERSQNFTIIVHYISRAGKIK